LLDTASLLPGACGHAAGGHIASGDAVGRIT
jgi:hypothetical protein